MNIRLSEHKIRFRVTQEEFSRLLAGDTIQTEIRFHPEGAWIFCVAPAVSQSETVFQKINNSLSVHIAKSDLNKLNAGIPSKEGIVVAEPVPTVILEIDVKRR